MRAIAIKGFGGPEVFERIETPRPSAGPGELLIDVHATSVNPVDYKIRRGDIPMLAGPFPAILHPDVSGVVVGLGPEVSGFAEGDAVYAFAGGLVGQPGALAQTVAVDARLAALAPRTLGFAEAAALPLVAVTAWCALVDCAAIGPGARVLVQGGTGGVGHVAAQLAASRGAEVFATCGSEAKRQVAEEIGAKQAFDYTRTSADDLVAATGGAGFDVVFNTPGAPSIDHSVACARPGGLILDILGDFPTRPGFQIKWLTFKSVFAGRPIVEGVDRESVGRILHSVARLVDDGRLRPLIDPQRFTFDQIGEAHAHAEHGRPTGKVVIARAA